MSHAFLLSTLLERLRAAEFTITPDDVVRAVAIVSRAEDLPAARLETLLGPLFATGREEQERFGRIFRELLEPAPAPAARPAPAAAPRRNVFRIAFVTTLAVLSLVFAVVRFSAPDPRQETTTSTASTVAPPQTIERNIPTIDPVLAVPQWAVVLAASLALIAALLVWLLLSRWLRRGAPSKAPEVGPPYHWELAPTPSPVLFPAEELARLSRALRGKAESESLRLDVARTIARTARRPAEPDLVYAADLVTPEYVVLIEKRSEDDHHAAYFDRLAALLARDGVTLRRHFFEYDPRVCWTTSRARTTDLADIRRRAPSARLLLCGGSDALFHPVTGMVNPGVAAELRWPMQVMVTADELPFEGVPALPAASGADLLSEIADVMSGGYRAKRAPQAQAQPLSMIATAREARARLSAAAYRWLCACAAHPRLQWELTLALGVAVCASDLASALRELVALPWFRTGRIPESERVALVDDLRRDPALELTARRVIVAILEKTEVPEGSFAARDRELQLLAQRIWLERHDASRLNVLFAHLRGFRLPEIGRDVTLVKLLLTAPGTRFAKRIPAALRKYWFRFGIPAMGRHPMRGGAEAFLAGALVLAVFPYTSFREPTGEWQRGTMTITVPVRPAAAVTPATGATATNATETSSQIAPPAVATGATTATAQTTVTAETTSDAATDTTATTPTASDTATTTQTTSAVNAPCALREDRRDCSVCLRSAPFGATPCVQWGNDPVCESAKAAQNATYKAEYEACLHGASLRKQNDLIEPANGAVVVADGGEATVTFRWTQEGVYRFFVKDAKGKDVGSLSGAQVAGTYFRATLPPGTYSWFVEPAMQLDDVELFRDAKGDPRFTVVNEVEVTAPLRCDMRVQVIEAMMPFPAAVVSARHGDDVVRVLNVVEKDGKTFAILEIRRFIRCAATEQATVTLVLQVVPAEGQP